MLDRSLLCYIGLFYMLDRSLLPGDDERGLVFLYSIVAESRHEGLVFERARAYIYIHGLRVCV